MKDPNLFSAWVLLVLLAVSLLLLCSIMPPLPAVSVRHALLEGRRVFFF